MDFTNQTLTIMGEAAEFDPEVVSDLAVTLGEFDPLTIVNVTATQIVAELPSGALPVTTC